MVELLNANQLKKKYKIYGHFYSLELKNNSSINCRSVLEICSNSMNQSLDNNPNLLPDALCIMMNPGSSKPMVELHSSIKFNSTSNLTTSLVTAKPDTTQYQIMRLMHNCKWNHIRVLNLSDIREANSRKFTQHFSDIETKLNFKDHSIFSDGRIKELSARLKRKSNAPIICAWGVNSKLEPLITQCLFSIESESNIIGLLKPGTTNKYFHPLPKLQQDKELWTKDMLKILKNII